jgi:acetyl esterase/lipase
MMRIAWEKQKHPLFRLVRWITSPKLTWSEKKIYIPRSSASYGYNQNDKRTTEFCLSLFYGGKEEDLKHVEQVVYHIPGGGFVCMDPECHADYLAEWASMSPKTLIIALDYGKAPEYPYPFALEEGFELYRLIRETNGACLGLSGWFYDRTIPTMEQSASSPVENRRKDHIKIILCGDSAGGNLATGVTMRAIEEGVMVPTSLVLMYPMLNINFTCWLSQAQTQLLRVESAKNVNDWVDSHSRLNGLNSHARPRSPKLSAVNSGESINMIDEADPSRLARKKSFFEIATSKLASLRTQKPHSVFDDYGNSLSEHYVDQALRDHESHRVPSFSEAFSDKTQDGDRNNVNGLIGRKAPQENNSQQVSLTSHMSHFNDRVLTPETMRALALLYLGSSPVRVDVANDYHLSPLQAPDAILVQFPKTYFICGEKDPLMDDTLIMAGKLRDAKRRFSRSRLEFQKVKEADSAHVCILEGNSHAFLQMSKFLPEGRDAINLVHEWFLEIFGEKNLEQQNNPVSDSSLSDSSAVRFTIGDREVTKEDEGSSSTSGSTSPRKMDANRLKEEEVTISLDEKDRLLEIRDNSRINQNVVLARRTLHVSHGLFGNDDNSKKNGVPGQQRQSRESKK